jgi:hypothetical protein
VTRPGAGHVVVRADWADRDVLSQLVADAFKNLAPSRWLITDPDARDRVFPGFFRICLEHALADGLVHTTPGRTATAPWTSRFEALRPGAGRPPPGRDRPPAPGDPGGPPGLPGPRPGTALLDARHHDLDRDGVPAYLVRVRAAAFWLLWRLGVHGTISAWMSCR